MWTPKAITDMVRDLVLLVAGVFGILYQQMHEVNVPLLIVFTAMTGVPGGVGLWRLVSRTALDQQPPSSSPPPPPQAGVSGP